MPTPAPDRLAALVAGKRWFAGTETEAQTARLFDWIPLAEDGDVGLAIVETDHEDGPRRQLAPVESTADGLRDAAGDVGFASAFAAGFVGGRVFAGLHGTAAFATENGASAETLSSAVSMPPRALGVEQSNASLVFGDKVILKLYRRLWPEPNPELEMGRRLTTVAGFAETPALLGWVEYRPHQRSEPWTLAVVHAFEKSAGDAWKWAVADATAHLETGKPPDIEVAAILGRLTARLHNALATGDDVSAFRPEPLQSVAIAKTAEASRQLAQRILDRLQVQAIGNESAERLLRDRARLFAEIDRIAATATPIGAVVRTHGDYHLGQILMTTDGFRIVDFEGEPNRPPTERRSKQSPLRDLAGLLRSYHYAICTATGGEPDAQGMRWYSQMCASCLIGYLQTISPILVPPDATDAATRLLKLYALEKCVYEVAYELDHRPDWLYVPVAGLQSMI